MKNIIFKYSIASLMCVLVVSTASKCRNDEPIPDDPDQLLGISYAPIPYNLKTWDAVNAPLSRMAIPADNALSVEGVELGRRLFYDKILSSNGSMSCASCHKPELGFADGQGTSKGVTGIFGKRSAMSLENVGFFSRGLFWDGRVRTLEEQALLPIEDPIELHENWGNVEEKLRNHADYPARFRKAFGISKKAEITKFLAAKALSQFQRTLISTGNAKFDRVARGEVQFSDDEFVGYQMFFDATGAGGKDAQCLHCHNSPFFSSNGFFNNGIDSVTSLDGFSDKGLGAITGNRLDNGKFRAPSLRNIMLTAPYMHDGRFQTIEQVIDHYASGGHYAENLDPFLPQIRDVRLSAREKRQLIAFLKTLTDSTFGRKPEFQNPF
jgi:cytochrome c peroxidase